MADVDPKRRMVSLPADEQLRLLQIVASPLRFRLMAKAAGRAFFETQGAEIVGLPKSKSGTIRKTHLATLADEGLLNRSEPPHVQYEITALGADVVSALRRALRKPRTPVQDDVLVMIASAPEQLLADLTGAEQVDLTLVLDNKVRHRVRRWRTMRFSANTGR